MSLATTDPDLVSVLDDVQREYRRLGIPQAIGITETLSTLAERCARFPRLTSAERQLREVHDRRCAEILMQASVVALLTGLEDQRYFHLTPRQIVQVERWSTPSHGQLASRVLEGMNTPFHDGDTPIDPLGITRRAVRLARASLSLCPSWKAQVHLCRGLTILGEWESARSVLLELLGMAIPNGPSTYYSLVTAAVFHASQEQWHHALSCYKSAARIHPRPSDAMNWFVLACALDLSEEALAASRTLDEFPSGTRIPLPTRGDRRPNRSPRPAVISMIDRLGMNSARIAHALLDTSS